MNHDLEIGRIPYEKSNNVECSLLQIQGRITRKDLLLRFTACALTWIVIFFAFVFVETSDYDKWVAIGGGQIQPGAALIETRHNVCRNIVYYIVPGLLFTFMAIQAAKRAHDCNRSSLYLLVPFYNIYLLFCKGTGGDNDYGLIPHRETKSPEYVKNTPSVPANQAGR